MEIKITGWGYENIRRFNTLDIDLLQGSTKLPHATLVMMRNGTGKTTTITLMRAALNGTAESWSPEIVRGFRPTRRNATQGKFYIKIVFDSELYYYFLNLDYQQGKAWYQTSRTGLSGGLESEHLLPIQLKGIFNEGFINRFIFDGEQAKKTLSSTSQEAELAVTYLYQINKLDELNSQINKLVTRKQFESDSKGKTAGSLSNNRTRAENREKIYLTLVLYRDKILLEITKANEKWCELEEQRASLIASDEKLRKEQSQLISDRAIQNGELNKAIQSISTKITEPFQVSSVFDERLQDLMQNMQTLKLPKTTAREFFRELSESDECICGRAIGPAEKDAIQKRANNYLGEDELSSINAIKDKLRNYQVTEELKKALEQMILLKEKVRNIQNALDRLVQRLNPDAMHKAEEIEAEQILIKQRLLTYERERDVLNAPIGAQNVTEQNNIAAAEKAFKEANENWRRATGTYEFTQRANKLISYIDTIKALTLEKLKNSIIHKTNEKIARIITDEQILVDKIDGSLILHDKTAVSEGQTLAIAYAYIGSLFEHSTFDFPFVIDSPAASMDLEVRREVATVLPTLFDQLIIFVTSGEIAGFAEKFYNVKNMLYVTIEGKKDDGNPACTFGKDYFSSYQSEEEE